jgi:hypothetical protein
MLKGSDAGALIYRSPDGQTRTTLMTDQLINPTGLKISDNGDIYISNKGFIAGQGEVLRLRGCLKSRDLGKKSSPGIG